MKKIFILLFVIAALTSCRKRKIEKDLDKTWSCTDFFVGTYAYVEGDNGISIEFKSIDDGTGEIIVTHFFNYNQYTYPGTFTLNQDYSEIDASMTTYDPGVTWDWDASLTVSSSLLQINGTSKYSDEAFTQDLSITGIP